MAIGRVFEQPVNDPVNICVMARAPVACQAKTRLIPALGAVAAARLQRQLTRRTVEVAVAADVGHVTLWCAPNTSHRSFRALARAYPILLRTQCSGHLGARMQQVFEAHGTDVERRGSSDFDCSDEHCSSHARASKNAATQPAPILLIGTDCAEFAAGHLRAAADALRAGNEAVLTPAEDGGYVLIGLRRPQPTVFDGIDWSTDRVLAQTRERLREAGLSWHECPTLWDVDRPADLARLKKLDEFAI